MAKLNLDNKTPDFTLLRAIVDYLNQHDFAETSGGGSSDYIPQGQTASTVGGLVAGTNLGTAPVTIQSILDLELYPTVSPSTTISATPSFGIYEKGNTQSSIVLSSTTTKHTNPITEFKYLKGLTMIYENLTPTPSGGSEGYTDSAGVSITTTYTASVTDGTNVGTATNAFTFVFPYFTGVGSPGLNVTSNGGGLTKQVIAPSASLNESFSPSSQVMYFCYDASYGALTSVKDVNNFETLPDWAQSTVTITNSYGVAVSCYRYEFANIVSGSLSYTFIR